MTMSPSVERWLPAWLSALAVVAWLGPLQWIAGLASQISDVPVYQRAYEQMANGALPYRDFSLEYPPGAAALFWLSGVLPGPYDATFATLMLIALVATVVAVTLTARALGFSPWRQAIAGGVVALSPLLLGHLLTTRFDLVLAALIAWMLWAAVTDRWTLAWVLLAVAILVKLVPLAFIPVLIIVHWRRHGWPSVARGAAWCAGIVAVVVVPLIITAPHGMWGTISYHLDRPLQLEATGSAYLMSLRIMAGATLAVESSFGSQGLAGDNPQYVATISTIVLVALIALIAWQVWRMVQRNTAATDAAILVSGIAATCLALLVAGKVLSPQFLVWILPGAVLITGKYGKAAIAVAVAALLMTQAYFPVLYWYIVALQTPEMLLLITRDILLIVLLALCWPRQTVADGAPVPPRESAVADVPPEQVRQA
jgi:hypothetical protein